MRSRVDHDAWHSRTTPASRTAVALRAYGRSPGRLRSPADGTQACSRVMVQFRLVLPSQLLSGPTCPPRAARSPVPPGPTPRAAAATRHPPRRGRGKARLHGWCLLPRLAASKHPGRCCGRCVALAYAGCLAARRTRTVYPVAKLGWARAAGRARGWGGAGGGRGGAPHRHCLPEVPAGVESIRCARFASRHGVWRLLRCAWAAAGGAVVAPLGLVAAPLDRAARLT